MTSRHGDRGGKLVHNAMHASYGFRVNTYYLVSNETLNRGLTKLHATKPSTSSKEIESSLRISSKLKAYLQ